MIRSTKMAHPVALRCGDVVSTPSCCGGSAGTLIPPVLSSMTTTAVQLDGSCLDPVLSPLGLKNDLIEKTLHGIGSRQRILSGQTSAAFQQQHPRARYLYLLRFGNCLLRIRTTQTPALNTSRQQYNMSNITILGLYSIGGDDASSCVGRGGGSIAEISSGGGCNGSSASKAAVV